MSEAIPMYTVNPCFKHEKKTSKSRCSYRTCHKINLKPCEDQRYIGVRKGFSGVEPLNGRVNIHPQQKYPDKHVTVAKLRCHGFVMPTEEHLRASSTVRRRHLPDPGANRKALERVNQLLNAANIQREEISESVHPSHAKRHMTRTNFPQLSMPDVRHDHDAYNVPSPLTNGVLNGWNSTLARHVVLQQSDQFKVQAEAELCPGYHVTRSVRTDYAISVLKKEKAALQNAIRRQRNNPWRH